MAGLEVAHTAGIIHRDIKPANVFVCRAESPGALQLIEAHANAVPPPPSTRTPSPIPSELDEAVMRALAKAPDDRFPSASMFLAALARIAGQLRPAPRGATPSARRFDTELVARSAGTPPPSPLYAPNAPPIVLTLPGAPLSVLVPEAQTVAGFSVAARRHRYPAIIAMLCPIALALLALALLAARGWTAR